MNGTKYISVFNINQLFYIIFLTLLCCNNSVAMSFNYDPLCETISVKTGNESAISEYRLIHYPNGIKDSVKIDRIVTLLDSLPKDSSSEMFRLKSSDIQFITQHHDSSWRIKYKNSQFGEILFTAPNLPPFCRELSKNEIDDLHKTANFRYKLLILSPLIVVLFFFGINL